MTQAKLVELQGAESSFAWPVTRAPIGSQLSPLVTTLFCLNMIFCQKVLSFFLSCDTWLRLVEIFDFYEGFVLE